MRMASLGAMPTTRGLERLIFFTDAVVAIAITLLILPLVDAASVHSDTEKTAAHFFTEEWPQVLAFLISFAVIARLWVAHHTLFEHVASYNGRVIFLSLAWVFTIVVLPLPTAMSAEFDTEKLTIVFYLGTMLVSSLLLTLLSLTVRGNSQLEASENPIDPRGVRGTAVMTILFGIALVVAVLVPGVNYLALLLLVLAGPIERVLGRRAARVT
ncbi:DUF1211 domain-containing membrane protein [Mycetocola zhadangensis]|nr:DUF1211 domain-containing membrane protein [Mycetocola zhadangensis]